MSFSSLFLLASSYRITEGVSPRKLVIAELSFCFLQHTMAKNCFPELLSTYHIQNEVDGVIESTQGANSGPTDGKFSLVFLPRNSFP